MQGGGPGERRAVSFIEACVLAKMLGPGSHRPNLGQRPWMGDILVEPPDPRAGAQPHPTHLRHNSEEGIAVGRIDAVPDQFQNPAGALMQQLGQLRCGWLGTGQLRDWEGPRLRYRLGCGSRVERPPTHRDSGDGAETRAYKERDR